MLLIDELETHLHYAAQADLVDVLMRQKLADQVIYSTHSVGALPPDLGTGVRAVVPIEGKQRSKIDNSFRTSGPGFTPLLFGLGASTLAVSIPRCAVITEGGSDAVLLPTLVREASPLGDLPYRVAPGLSNTPINEIHRDRLHFPLSLPVGRYVGVHQDPVEPRPDVRPLLELAEPGEGPQERLLDEVGRVGRVPGQPDRGSVKRIDVGEGLLLEAAPALVGRLIPHGSSR